MQPNLDIFPTPLPPASLEALAAVEVLASQGGVEARGVVFTRREVVDFILDLAGYTPDKPSQQQGTDHGWPGLGQRAQPAGLTDLLKNC